jgi:WD40 repeat protein
MSLAATAAAGVGLIGLVGCNNSDETATPDAKVTASEAAPASGVVGERLYAVRDVETKNATPTLAPNREKVDPVVIYGCRLTVIDKFDLASPREGILLFLGTDLKPGEKEKLPPDRVVKVKEGGKDLYYRVLREDDEVEPEMLLGRLDDRVARDELASKLAKVVMAEAELKTAVETREEARARYDRVERLGSRGGSSPEEINERKLAYRKYYNDVLSKDEAITVAKKEANQAKTLVELHEIHSPVAGIIKTIYKRRSESVKNLEPVLQVVDLSKLRAEGLIDLQYLGRLHKGMKAMVEPTVIDPPVGTYIGHLQEVNSVAVSKDAANSLIVSASEDGTVRVWNRKSDYEVNLYRHPAAVKAVACTPPGASANLCLSGAGDGHGRLWDLDSKATTPLRELKGEHHGAILCVAFSPDGKFCATGGEDRDIQLWDTATGELRYRFPAGHRAAVTSIQFTPQSQLVSAGKDSTIRLWTVGDQGAKLEATFPSRSGQVSQVGVSPDGKKVLFDQGRELRLLSLPEGRTQGVLQNPSAASNFSGFAGFSPDGRLIATTCQGQAGVQLWTVPGEHIRGREVRQLISRDQSPATCAAFSPDGSFIVTGTHNHRVMVWHTPSAAETEQRYPAVITLVDPTVEANARQVRIWADLANPTDPKLRLKPGTSVTLVIDPEQK